MNRWLLVWVVVSAGLCWMPSGWLIGSETWLFPTSESSSGWAVIWREARDYLAHGVLMAGVGYFLMKTISLGPESVNDSAEMEKVGIPSSTGIEEGMDREVDEASNAAEKTMKRSQGKRISIVLSLVFVFALLIEAGQALLPASFQRGFSWGDLAASMVGGLVGCYPLLGNRLEMKAGYPKKQVKHDFSSVYSLAISFAAFTYFFPLPPSPLAQV